MPSGDRIRARAEALGVWQLADGWLTRWRSGDVSWSIDPDGDLYEVALHGATGVLKAWGLDETTAEVWLLALASGATVTRRCPDCARRGGSHEWRLLGSFMMGARHRLEAHGWTVGLELNEDGFAPAMRPCPTCDATGRITVEAARLVCEAAPLDADEVSRRMMTAEPGTDGLDGHRRVRAELLAVAYGLDPGESDERRSLRGRGCKRCVMQRDGVAVFCAACRPEPDEALVLRDWLDDRGVRFDPETGTLAPAPELLADYPTQPRTGLGRVLVAWLGGESCGVCDRGWIEPAPVRGKVWKERCEACAGKGTACAALLEQLAGPGWDA